MIRFFPLIAPYSNIGAYGMRGDKMHDAVDLGCPANTIVVAADDGTVSYGSNQLGGNTAVLHCPDGTAHYMAHLRDVQTGTRKVVAGDAIGIADTTGNAAGGPTHLHFQLWANGTFAGPHPDPTAQLVAAPHVVYPAPEIPQPVTVPSYVPTVLVALGIVGFSGALAWALTAGPLRAPRRVPRRVTV
jgi:murein DD-endopeptidase MepM/ murein hydrolase activator NlpD